MSTITPEVSLQTLRDNMTRAYRMDETACLDNLISRATLPEANVAHLEGIAKQLVIQTRAYKKKQGGVDSILHQYDLSTDEGIALMCLAEALLRIPDKATLDKFISDKLSTTDWKEHLSKDNTFFVNATTWSLLLTGKIYAPTLDSSTGIAATLKRTTSRLGVAVIRPVLLQMMKIIGKQFVMGQTIESALKRAVPLEEQGYRFSYDMLGEAARTAKDAAHYYDAYVAAITAIGSQAHAPTPAENPGISVKLSALHPRYDYTKHDEIVAAVAPQLLALAQQAKKYNIGLTVDAEEADKLDLSLDILEQVFADPSLAGWEGLGLAVQAYQKRAFYVIEWLAALSKRHQRRLMVRLVKGAYWDTEIKLSQMQGAVNYPVFTRKNATDVSYLACAREMLARPDCFYPQFGTHNAYTVAAILEMAGDTPFEFQCLHGMGRPLYDHVVDKASFNRPCRTYAPVGTHKDLLGYLVRRLLENGANSSFVNKLADDDTPVEAIIENPVARIKSLTQKQHPRIPLPDDIYGNWQNSRGIDLSNRADYATLMKGISEATSKPWKATPLIHGNPAYDTESRKCLSPSDSTRQIGEAYRTTPASIEIALQAATAAKETWGRKSVEERAAILERAAVQYQEAMPELAAMLTQEAGKCVPDSLSEIRETIDYCRYYAYRARCDLEPLTLPGPTGEKNQLFLYPRGVIVCISPWNFPLAIFMGQILAALVTGNVVIAKPAEQTPLIAYRAVQILHQAGVPTDALQLVLGSGSSIGSQLVKDSRVAGVIFTGSTATAKLIERNLVERPGPMPLLIAETGGQNAMIVDSSALAEQAVIDIANSAFNSAGQRCSALRVLFVQEEMAPTLLTMLKGYMATLAVNHPDRLTTDVGPVIDSPSLKKLEAHAANMQQQGELIAEVPLNKQLLGHYFAPRAFEIPQLGILKEEVFGPILHVIRYRASELDSVMDAIIATGYGLTLGVHSRIEATIQHISSRMPVGNVYVNRNMIGAVVGVQPFGGENLSGTGPKAGGPHYLPKLCVERAVSTNLTAVGGNARLVSLTEDM
ncbi:MAG TPA: bifunctional proline dehydrogenase/L-glutamate gamma-semialdehyde dehydrogenase PutA [Gammaproteobacteria bacterium]|jgi:RHH-type proline utilization regulon transcriptional repressor/proline dehydrogenase/delta 1-pyrroline-5-carboxylate dehydrogenase|nr:bifunctional proline dehydrogenase/L-glutamate gamma-semialdehyde dehydrogenase PutA [Gammaproteobacteria bacterium]